ncbi:hypothetical protein BDZ91DRAFT_727952 [Kalaharituber pfeilii]|nr:hypothetical protein BDZ91DRAFT_727952 [Kalaharituber pfeilii]
MFIFTYLRVNDIRICVHLSINITAAAKQAKVTTLRTSSILASGVNWSAISTQ